jgi:hypothetical protein
VKDNIERRGSEHVMLEEPTRDDVTQVEKPPAPAWLSMQEYDLYINPQKPAVGLYARKGAGLPDLADPKEWVFDGTAAQDELPSSLVQSIEANGHAFRNMD